MVSSFVRMVSREEYGFLRHHPIWRPPPTIVDCQRGIGKFTPLVVHTQYSEYRYAGSL